MYDLLIKNASVVRPDGIETTDVAISNGIIQKIAYPIHEPSKDSVEAINLLLLPGCIDPHVHLRTPGATEKEDMTTGTKAAIRGGYTTVLDMPNTNPPTITQQALDEKKSLARDMSYCNIGFHMGVTPGNIKMMKDMKGIRSIKMYMGSSTGSLLVDDLSLQEAVFKNAGDLIVCVHAEDESCIKKAAEYYKDHGDPEIHSAIRHRECAILAVKKAVEFAKKYGTKLHVCHISTKEELDIIREAKKEGVHVTCEVGPHHLYLNDHFYTSLQNFVKMNPPVRSEKDNEAMWEGLRNKSIDCIGSDHAPHTKEEKELPYWKAPSGVPELDTTLQLLLLAVHEEKITLEDLIRITATKPAEIFHLGKRGFVQEGYTADLILVDFHKPWVITNDTLETKCKWSPYKNWEGHGMNVLTILGGEVVYDTGHIRKGNNIEIF